MGNIILIALIIWFVVSVNKKNQKNTKRGTNLNGRTVYTGTNYSSYNKPTQKVARNNQRPMQNNGYNQRPAQNNMYYQQRPVQNGVYQQNGGQVSQQELKRCLQQKYDNTPKQPVQGNTYQKPEDVMSSYLGIVDINQESPVLKKVNDLIVMGYSGDLNFERDFVAEGVEMLNSYEL